MSISNSQANKHVQFAILFDVRIYTEIIQINAELEIREKEKLIITKNFAQHFAIQIQGLFKGKI